MLLRPRQETMVGNIVGALSEHDNTLAVAPTGAGKTVMLSAALGRMFKKGSLNKACVLQHRDELTTQNSATFLRMNPSLTAGFFNAEAKSWRGDVGFAMVQTLTRPENRETMPVLDALIIDEAHHACADSYLRIIEQARKNIGMASGDDCIRFNNFFMYFLPHLLALSASSPFWQGTDTGLSSCRPTTYEALPTAGQPYHVRNWKDFENLYESLKKCGSIKTLKDLWWDMRPSPGFGTLEIRVCDGCATLSETLYPFHFGRWVIVEPHTAVA